MIGDIAGGFATLLDPVLFGFLLVGFFIGIVFGTIPGLTATLAVALLLPLTFGMETLPALVTIVGIYAAGIYSGGITGMLIRIPGAPGGAISGFEGYELTKRGAMTRALGYGAFASMVGGVLGAIFLFVLLEPVADIARMFQSVDKFSLVLLALVIVAVLYAQSLVKGIISTTIGLMLATIGIDPFRPIGRLTFAVPGLEEGIGLLVAVVGIFAVAEVIRQAEIGGEITEMSDAELRGISIRDFAPKIAELRELGPLIFIKSSIIGHAAGILPGAGAAMASLLSYGEAKRSSKTPEEFGQGSLEGIVSAEAGNNAMCPGAIIPLLVFGIPGDAVTALILGVLLIHGLVPGPRMLAEQSELITPMLAAFAVTPFLIFISIFVLGKYYANIIRLNKALLYSFISMIAIVGVYAATYSPFQLWMVIAVGVITYLLAREGYPQIPFLMGFILGPFFENYLRSALLVHRNDPTVFFTRPISLGFIVLTVIFAYLLGTRIDRIGDS